MLRGAKFAGAILAVATGVLFIGLGWAGQTRSGVPPPHAAAVPKPPAVAVSSLYESGSVRFSAPPPVIVSPATACDAGGNIYVQYSASVEPPHPPYWELNMPLTKIALDSKSTTEFKVPAPEGYVHRYGDRFYVTPRGNVYDLIEAYRHGPDYKEGPNWPDSFVAEYKDDGSVDSLTKLELPEGSHFFPGRLGVFGDGTFLVTGWEAAEVRYIPTSVLTAVFDRAGTYVGPVTLRDDVRPEGPWGEAAVGAAKLPPPEAGRGRNSQPKQSAAPSISQVVSGGPLVGSPDGNIYLFRATSPALVYVISAGGAVARQFRITPPRPGLVPIGASFGGQGELLVEFSSSPTAQAEPGSPVAALVDPETGDVIQVVGPPSPIADIPACLSPQREFLFLRASPDHHLEVAKFISR